MKNLAFHSLLRLIRDDYLCDGGYSHIWTIIIGMCRSTGYGCCLSESGTGSTNQRFCLEQGILFDFLTLKHGRDYYFAARIAVQMNIVAVPARVPLHVHSNTPFPIRRSTASHLFSRFCLEQGSKIASLRVRFSGTQRHTPILNWGEYPPGG